MLSNQANIAIFFAFVKQILANMNYVSILPLNKTFGKSNAFKVLKGILTATEA
jgi:hypothetical protein